MTSKSRITTTVNLLGVFGIVTSIIYTCLSFSLAASQPSLMDVNQERFFSALETSSHLPRALLSILLNGAIFREGLAFLAGYCVPLIIETVIFFVAVALIVRNSSNIDDTIADKMLLWSIGFALAAVPAFDVLTQDIWFSVAWGRMVDHGVDPFTIPYTAAFAHDLPLDKSPIRATYGPLWIGVASLITWVSFGSPLVAWFLLKLVLFAAWLGCLWLVSDLARELGPYRRCLAIAIAGWLPLCVHSTLAEGHNDAAMMFFVLLWAKIMRDRGSLSMVALALSVLMKYVSMPLAVVDALYFLGRKPARIRDYLSRVVPAAIVGGLVLAIVAYFGWFGDETTSMANWKFLDPAGVFRALIHLSGLELENPLLSHRLSSAARLCVGGFFFFVALQHTAKLAYAHSSQENIVRAQLSMMAFIMFVVVGHVWPWFFVWCIPFAALIPDFWLSRFVIGAACIAPFTISYWAHFQMVDTFYTWDLPSLPMYTSAVLVTALFGRTFGRSVASKTR